MKIPYTIVAIFLSFSVFAQKTETSSIQHYDIETASSISKKGIVNDINEAKSFLKQVLDTDDYNDLRLLSDINSPFGRHYTFVQTFEGIEVYQALIKLNTDEKGNITSILNSMQDVSNYQESLWPSVTNADELIPSNHQVNTAKLVWAKQNEQFVKCLQVKHTNAQGYYFENLYNINKELVYQTELSAHFAPSDTTAKALVYLPNPLTKANTIYQVGTNYADNNDATNADLDALRDTVDVDVTYDNGVFSLANPFVIISEHSLPVVAPVTETTPFFFYDRSQSGFEDVNVLYHITKQQKYIQSLGFMDIVNYQIPIDCHGFNGADNSAFTSGTNPPSIIFGEGGVDDAEDADVIIHEYSHAIMHSASPNTNFGTERNAMDEAFGDYMAASYAMLYDDYHNDYAFKWDGHNEYWPGRLTVSNAIYPDDLQYHLYRDAPIWSSAIMRIERNIGRDKTVSIALEAAYSFSSNMTMAQAAELYITTDSLIYNGIHYAEICWTFKDKGMVSSCSVDKPGDLLGLNDLDQRNVVLLNTENFAKGISPLEIISNQDFKLHVYDLTGKLLQVYNSENHELLVSPNQFNTGAFIFKVSSEANITTFKVAKF
jgi:hypothetical protein